MAVTFECTTESTLNPQSLFDLSRDVSVHTRSMAGSRESTVGGVRSGPIGLGEDVTWRAWHFGLPLQMTSQITAMQEPATFTDEQTRGPFRYFRHQHEFHPHGTGTTMVDRISFAAPLGVLGWVAERLVLARYLRRLIERRNTFLQQQVR
jgi:ligand-binding SRPBCC domain-containing protein